MKYSLLIALIIGVVSGLSIAYVDTRPHWDDAGISVLMILSASFVSGAISPQKTWLIALSVGIWIPLFNIASTNNYSSLIALVPAFVGAYAGFLTRKVFAKF
jgi:formate-dependent nitrite reductase membrane component NrfD